MRGIRAGIVAVLIGAGLSVAACAAPGTAPLPGSRWMAPPGVATTAPVQDHPAAGPFPTSSPGRTPLRPPAASAAPTSSKGPTRAPAVPVSAGRGPAGSVMTTGGRGVALTFDDGPDPVQTPKILDLLAKYHVRATFCVVGQNVQAHPELIRRIVAEGHTLCNHTWRHSLTLGRESPSVIRADLQRTNEAIHRAAPGARIAYLRAPGGNFTPAFVRVAAQLGMTSIYWYVDPRDWDHPAGESDAAHRSRVVAAVEMSCRPGAIILSHDYGQPDTIDAYRTLIPWLKARYKLVSPRGRG